MGGGHAGPGVDQGHHPAAFYLSIRLFPLPQRKDPMRTCEACGKSLGGRTARARFCDSTCRMRAARDGPAAGREPSAAEVANIERMDALCRRDLAGLGYEQGSLVESLVVLARQIADPRTSAAGLVACVRDLRRGWPQSSRGQRPDDELTPPPRVTRRSRDTAPPLDLWSFYQGSGVMLPVHPSTDTPPPY